MVTLALALALAQPPVTLWVDPRRGSDRASGATRAHALRTVTAAWNRIPTRKALARGYRIRLTAGTYRPADVPNYWESRWGTASAPITIESADGQGRAILPGLNVFDVRHLTLSGLRLRAGGGDVFHCERCEHLTIAKTQIRGSPPGQETVKVNQSSHVTIVDSDISGAEDNTIDFVAVQHGEISRNRISGAGDWCMYVKGGSAYLRVEGNEIFDCGTGGFTAGQGTGFEFMVAPWLHYEAYGVVFANNVVHDTDGAGMGVNGGYNVLLAHNTLYKVGARSHVLEAVFGLRACDGNTARCRTNLAQGGWGTTSRDEEPIGNRNVYVLNNVVYNPAPFRSRWQQLAVYGPRTPSPGTNIPSPARADTNLRIEGNVIWNGPPDHPLGIEDDDQGCRPANPACNAAQLRAQNEINTLEPRLRSPERGDFRPAAGSPLLRAPIATLPAFSWGDAPRTPPVAPGTVSTAAPRDRDGRRRGPGDPPGAYAAP